MRCHPSICPFKYYVLFFLFFLVFNLFAYIMFHLHYNNKSNNLAQWWPHRSSKTKRLEVRGSIPASSNLHFSNIFQEIKCTHGPDSHHTPSPIQAPDGQRARSGGQILKEHHRQVKRLCTGSEKSNGSVSNGLANFYSHTSKPGPISLLSYIFVYFI